MVSSNLHAALEAIAHGEPASANDAILYLAEVICVNRQSGYVSDTFPVANAELLSDDELSKIEEALKVCVNNSISPGSSAAIWALGKFGSPDLVVFLRSALSNQIARAEPDVNAVAQLLVALDSSGESGLLDSSFSALEHEKNLSNARKYVARLRAMS